MTDVLVVGGGVIGLGVAWRLASRGASVTLLEADASGARPEAASRAAGGMLAPAAEIQFEELDLYRLGRESLRRWPAFAEDLEAASGQPIGYRTEGTLVAALDRDDAEALRRLFRFQREQGVPVEWLATADALDREPFLSPRLAGAIWSPEDHQVDNRALHAALREAALRAGVTMRDGEAVEAVEADESAPAVVTAAGERMEACAIVVAAGVWAGRLAGLPLRPVKGQMLSLRMAAPFALSHVVRTPRVYLIPKPDGRLVVGATSEEMGHDVRVTAGGLYRLLEDAVEAVPGVEELELIETWAGLRPAARDHQPVLGFGAMPGVALAAGHYRHGILLTPITADAVAETVLARLAGRDETPPEIAPFSPARFPTS